MSAKHTTQSPNLNSDHRQNSKRPDERSILDSRKNEEQDFKGGDTTHNKKETEKGKLKKK